MTFHGKKRTWPFFTIVALKEKQVNSSELTNSKEALVSTYRPSSVGNDMSR